ncbi:5-formyltetrahydrofolate cyclo-ligase [Pisciglobus halotolerans]|uniref:5-formyltetrahydrofolate cyclo-ligase n=1 Tax=Pisciglobus halotolerans TaxID=745365 RepID=A0A1I3CER1_9LACT|nr:5-formyltetrahydrofolate cyclo-ligase [Pisciglobus halotolerans]SFH73030.1 5-formyltetrahydrofolate cyclo-ligase [Pisciglobus halotolerans]
MNKQKIRTDMIQLLKSYPKKEKQREEEKIMHTLFKTKMWKNAKTIAVVMAQDFEFDTNKIIEKAWEEGKTVALPRAKAGGIMDVVPYSKDMQLERTSFGILEPARTLTALSKKEIELIIVPGLAFSTDGFRVGFGGGYYDRFLKDYDGVTVSLVLEKQLIALPNPEPFDVPLDFLITADQIFRFNR